MPNIPTESAPLPHAKPDPQLTVARIGAISTVVAAVIGAAATMGILFVQKPATEQNVSGLFDRWFPVGTIVASVLSPKEFSAAAGDSGSFDTKSKWIPADGRAVGGSSYAQKLGHANVPDLRGLFLRGLNVFDPSVLARNPAELDPDTNRTPGDYRPDAFAKHSHRLGNSLEYGSGHSNAFSAAPGDLKFSTEPTGDSSETRPKNSAVYYYIKIN
jgi:hypothetical protein